MPQTNIWPALPYAEWRATRDTLHLWMQIVGKVRLALAPMINHWWQVPLYITARGLTTSAVPYEDRSFQIDFDFISHSLIITCSDGKTAGFVLKPQAVADFYRAVMKELKALGIKVKIWTMPVEIAGAVPFEKDSAHTAYDADAANRFWRVLAQSTRVLTQFRSHFTGKVSPVHFFWGSFDLAVTRFSGRTAPAFPGTALQLGKWVMEEAYSHEVSSCGFWPGDERFPEPAFYSYAYPVPPGFERAKMQAGAYWHKELGEFILPYDVVRKAGEKRLLAFCESTYAAAADLAKWDRKGLERKAG